MNIKRNILKAFILNLSFSVFELFGGFFSGSTAILSDALHDFGDALSIGVSFFLERKSEKHSDEKYTFGYSRYSILGSIVTTLILLVGSCVVVYNAAVRIIYPTTIKYEVMIIFAFVGVTVNTLAALTTRKGNSLNQKAVNLHMLEDTFGWAVVLLGAVVMRFTDITIIDPMISIATTLFVCVHAVKNLKSSLEIMLEKCPETIDVGKLKAEVSNIDDVEEVKSINVWSIDEENICATVQVVVNQNHMETKRKLRRLLLERGMTSSVIEICKADEFASIVLPPRETEQCHHHHHYHHI